MKYLISYSGGLGSFMAAYMTIKKYGKDKCTLVFTDTCTEDPDLYRFLAETAAWLGAPLVTLKDGRNIWEVFRDVKFLGNSRIDPCSKILKRELFRKWVTDNYSAADVTLVFGISKEESHRLTSIKERWAPYDCVAPLCEVVKSREDIEDVLDTASIALPRLYELGFKHNNCGGCCVKAGQKQFKLLLEKLPEVYAWHEAQQEASFKICGKHPFLKKSIKGEITYLSLKEFREMLEAGESCDGYISDGCGCFV